MCSLPVTSCLAPFFRQLTGTLYIPALVRFIAATKQYDDIWSVSDEVKTIARAVVDAHLKNTFTYGPYIAQVAFGHTPNSCVNL